MKMATVLQAEMTDNYSGWATQRAFQLDGAMVTALAASLPAPKSRPRRVPENGSYHRSLRRGGARTPPHDPSEPTVSPLKPAPKLTVEGTTRTERKARYIVEIRSAAGVSHFLTTADWTDRERDLATAAILPLLGLKPADPSVKPAKPTVPTTERKAEKDLSASATRRHQGKDRTHGPRQQGEYGKS